MVKRTLCALLNKDPNEWCGRMLLLNESTPFHLLQLNSLT